MCRSLLVLAVAGSLAWPLALTAAESELADIVRERHEKFERMGEAFEDMERESHRPEPDAGLLARNADQIDTWAHEQLGWFPAGTGPEDGFKTKAKQEIWTDSERFNSLQTEFIAEAGKLKLIAAGGDASAIAAQVEKTGAVCSECHEVYRKQFSLFSIFGF